MSHYYHRRLAAQLSRRLAGPPILLFDDRCRLCRALVAFVAAHEHSPTLRFCPVGSPAGQALAMHFDLMMRDAPAIVLLENGRALERSAAVTALLGHLRRPWYWLRIARLVPARLLDWCYDQIARNRRRIAGTLPGAGAATGTYASRLLISL